MLKSLVRRLCYEAGLLGLYHRLLNSKNLTVVMFHRVLPRDDPRWDTAEREYTMREDLFERCIEFFARHYTPVTMEQVAEACRRGHRLPAKPLLVTFDDGWSDNLSIALPILKGRRVPAVIFVSASVVDDQSEVWWQDLVVYGWNTGILSSGDFADFRLKLGLLGSQGRAWADGTSILKVLVASANLDPESRDRFLAPIKIGRCFAPPRQMLDGKELADLSKDSLIAIGSHGRSHMPLTCVTEPALDLTESKSSLETLSGCKISSFSFPHGRYDSSLVAQARGAGYECVFTSDAVLNPVREKPIGIFGRIGIPARQIVDCDGNFAADRLATWLFKRASTSLEFKSRTG